MGSTEKALFSVLPVGSAGFQVIETDGASSRVYCEVPIQWMGEGSEADRVVDARDRANFIVLALDEACNGPCGEVASE